jgi:hypothetical protein
MAIIKHLLLPLLLVCCLLEFELARASSEAAYLPGQGSSLPVLNPRTH